MELSSIRHQNGECLVGFKRKIKTYLFKQAFNVLTITAKLINLNYFMLTSLTLIGYHLQIL